MSKKKHLEILDRYAKGEIEQPKKELAEAYKDYKKLVSELNDAEVDEEERLREVSFLEYEVGEIEEAGLTVGEDEELDTQYKLSLVHIYPQYFCETQPVCAADFIPCFSAGGWCCREYCKWNPCVRCAWGGCHDCRCV